ncbi:NlpC/P60 family protein [Alicyclobacillus fodiniaquatilis]|jgi:cell wall-associated NlpC family hydrolase|uniref:NlpC/P60 family protein n=1 Tax=Alicyclobacillus fodiniaquatilis TaxID=1661150 RepID=A0ABW4JNN5_9BACL
MNFKVKLASLTVSTMALLTFTLPTVQADSLSDENQKLSDLQSQASSLSNQIQSNQAKAAALTNAIDSYNDALHNVSLQIDTTNQQMAQLQSREKTLTIQLAKNQKELTAKQDELVQLLTTEYEDGHVPYLAVLFHATSFQDLLSRIYNMTLVSNAQNNVVNSVKQLKQSLVTKQNAVKASENQQKKVKTQLLSLQATDRTIKASREHDLTQIKSRIQSGQAQQGELESQISLTQSQIQAIKAETLAAETQAANPSYVAQQQASLVSASASGIVGYAESFMGTPYVWGGTSPSGFDCSGFTQYVLGHFGVSITRTSEEQFASGVPVSESDLQPGDLVFFSTYAPGASHVGIYIGGGMMVDAEDNGVSLDSISNSYWGPKYIGARRYIK